MKKVLRNISPFNGREEMPLWQYFLKTLLAFGFCYLVSSLLGEALVIGLLFAMGKNPLVGEMLSSNSMMLLMYYGYLIFIAVILIYWKLVFKKPLKDMGITKHFCSYFLGAILGIIVVSAVVLIAILSGSIRYRGMVSQPQALMLLLFLGGFLVQGAMEELFCRGLVFHSLKRKTSFALSAVVSTLVFVLPHYSSLFSGEVIYGLMGILNMVLVSLIWTSLTVRFQSIWAACAFHSFWNFLLFNVWGLNLSGNDYEVPTLLKLQSIGDNLLNGSLFGLEASVITTAVLGILLLLLLKKRK